MIHLFTKHHTTCINKTENPKEAGMECILVQIPLSFFPVSTKIIATTKIIGHHKKQKQKLCTFFKKQHVFFWLDYRFSGC